MLRATTSCEGFFVRRKEEEEEEQELLVRFGVTELLVLVSRFL